MPPPPPEVAGWVDLVIWGAVLFIMIIIAVAFAEYLLKWLRSPLTQSQPTQPSTTENEIFKELLREVKALREEIRELRRELRE